MKKLCICLLSLFSLNGLASSLVDMEGFYVVTGGDDCYEEAYFVNLSHESVYLDAYVGGQRDRDASFIFQYINQGENQNKERNSLFGGCNYIYESTFDDGVLTKTHKACSRFRRVFGSELLKVKVIQNSENIITVEHKENGRVKNHCIATRTQSPRDLFSN